MTKPIISSSVITGRRTNTAETFMGPARSRPVGGRPVTRALRFPQARPAPRRPSRAGGISCALAGVELHVGSRREAQLPGGHHGVAGSGPRRDDGVVAFGARD